MISDETLAELPGKVELAHKEICDLAAGKKKWTMCIPVEPDDSDMVLQAPLDDIPALLTLVREQRDELEILRGQLAGCGVAALQNSTAAIQYRITRDNPYWSASYGDVCAAVDREMELRAENAKLREALEKITTIENKIR
jgi:hypothetical protein